MQGPIASGVDFGLEKFKKASEYANLDTYVNPACDAFQEKIAPVATYADTIVRESTEKASESYEKTKVALKDAKGKVQTKIEDVKGKIETTIEDVG